MKEAYFRYCSGSFVFQDGTTRSRIGSRAARGVVRPQVFSVRDVSETKRDDSDSR